VQDCVLPEKRKYGVFFFSEACRYCVCVCARVHAPDLYCTFCLPFVLIIILQNILFSLPTTKYKSKHSHVESEAWATGYQSFVIAVYNEHNFVYRMVCHCIMKIVNISFKFTKARDGYSV
jgi:hypothetical protein